MSELRNNLVSYIIAFVGLDGHSNSTRSSLNTLLGPMADGSPSQSLPTLHILWHKGACKFLYTHSASRECTPEHREGVFILYFSDLLIPCFSLLSFCFNYKAWYYRYKKKDVRVYVVAARGLRRSWQGDSVRSQYKKKQCRCEDATKTWLCA